MKMSHFTFNNDFSHQVIFTCMTVYSSSSSSSFFSFFTSKFLLINFTHCMVVKEKKPKQNKNLYSLWYHWRSLCLINMIMKLFIFSQFDLKGLLLHYCKWQQDWSSTYDCMVFHQLIYLVWLTLFPYLTT